MEAQNHQNQEQGPSGGDEFPQGQPQPSTSGGAAAPRHTEPSLRTLCFRGLHVSRCLIYRVATRFSGQPLGQNVLDAVNHALSAAEHTTLWANAAANEHQSAMWYVMVPISICLMVARTGADLAERYLDIQLPENQDLVNWLQGLRTRLQIIKENASRVHSSHKQQKQQPSRSTVELALSPSSSVSSLDVYNEHSSSEEEIARPETPGDKSMYFSVEQPMEVEEETEATVDHDEREKVEDEAQQTKPEEQPAVAEEEVGGAAMSTERPQPSASPEHLKSAEEAERAAMEVLPQPSAQPASSQDLVAAEASSGAQPGSSGSGRRGHKASSKATKGMLFLSLFGAKLG
ncbi:uncharacterized protein LOC126272451 [Schistocerca gregaria]|uniref:uncharacterized protein LOC126272451 n=1 Tax=Schistocerca gregaria TaxID=7010 RepID=UPI00211E525D|nr:uncharacterized protein LOC126272451 [Schistocerca gregaria]